MNCSSAGHSRAQQGTTVCARWSLISASTAGRAGAAGAAASPPPACGRAAHARGVSSPLDPWRPYSIWVLMVLSMCCNARCSGALSGGASAGASPAGQADRAGAHRGQPSRRAVLLILILHDAPALAPPRDCSAAGRRRRGMSSCAGRRECSAQGTVRGGGGAAGAQGSFLGSKLRGSSYKASARPKPLSPGASLTNLGLRLERLEPRRLMPPGNMGGLQGAAAGAAGGGEKSAAVQWRRGGIARRVPSCLLSSPATERSRCECRP